MKTILIALLLQQQPFTMPPRNAVPNPATLNPIPQKLKKDYDKLWTRFLKGTEDVKVMKDAENLLKKNRTFSQLIAMEAYLDLYGKRYKDAETRFDKVLSLDNRHRVALSYLAEFAFGRDEYARASDLYDRLMEVDPTRTDVETKREKALLLATEILLRSATRADQENRVTDAENLYQQALRIAPKEPQLHGRLADLYARQKKWEPALGEFQKQRELGGASDEIDQRIAEALAGLGRTEEARDVLERLRRSGGGDSSITTQLSELEDLGRWGNEVSRFREIKAAAALSREQLATVLVRYFPQVNDFRKTPQVLTDIQPDSKAVAEIQAVVGLGLIDARSNHTFQAATSVTRAEFGRAMSRLIRLLANSSPAGPPVPTADVAAGTPLYTDIQGVLGRGIMSLDDAGNFNPNGTISGDESVHSIERLLEITRQIG